MPSIVAPRRINPATLAALAVGSLLPLTGCTWISYLGTDTTGSQYGRTYYLGGAGTFGHVGTIDVPTGLREAGYTASTEVFGWQAIFGGTLRDQIDQGRNEGQARRLARRIVSYARRYPGRRVNIIALSAGTGIATWALEVLPPDVHVGTVIFLGSSLSADYNLGRALQHVDDRIYNFYSPDDPILKYALPIAGSVDRQTRGENIAGLMGFVRPPGASGLVQRLYAERVSNQPYRKRWQEFGYHGRHTDSTSVDFVRYVLAPLVMRPIQGPATPSVAGD